MAMYTRGKMIGLALLTGLVAVASGCGDTGAVLGAADFDVTAASDVDVALLGTDAAQTQDTLSGTDAAAGTDATPGSDADAATDAAAGTDADSTTDAATGTDADSTTDAVAGTDADSATDAAAGTDADSAKDAISDTGPTDAGGTDVVTTQACLTAAAGFCDDGNACTTDGCDSTFGCVHLANLDACSDGNACTTGDVCDKTNCNSGSATDCDDNNACTTDSCTPVDGCVHLATTATCDDGSACTSGDVCAEAKCQGATIACSDDNPCTDDACDAKSGCVHLANAATCTDGDACTSDDACADSQCAGVTISCDDGKICTTDLCDKSTGCGHTDNALACNDGSLCTQTDACSGGKCVGTNPVTCTASDGCHVAGTCDGSTGVCSNPAASNGAACDDNNPCTTSDGCQSGACTGGATVTCPAKACQTASCNVKTGACDYAPIVDGMTCDDGNLCTQTDTCKTGACSGANPVVCSALDQCHDAGTCDSATGKCGNPNKADATTCNDGNACTQTDTCVNGACTGSNSIVCSASDQCHNAGTCDAGTGGCSNPNKTDATPCTDGMVCTVSDACKSGSCTGTVSCDDGNACTADACAVDGTCAHTALAGTTCSDGNGCTSGDICGGVDGKSCVAVTTCDSNATCVGSGAGATCTCKTGYTGTGFVCAAKCGDGIIVGAEGCDDGNVASEDGCSYKCTSETGWSCTGATKSTCTATTCLQSAFMLSSSNVPSAGNGYAAAVWSSACTTSQFSVTSNGITPYTFISVTPNALTAKTQTHSFPRYPTLNANGVYQASMGVTGVTVNGLAMYAAIEAGPQNYGDPVYNAIVDGCSGHTSPQEYHYHALQMKCLVASALTTATPWLNADPATAPSPLVGWAADGFPIYGPVACKDAECTTTETVLSGYTATGNPATHSFLAYTWSAHTGDARYLDACNGRVEPNGAYHYHATSTFPYVPACFKGVPAFKGNYAPASEGMPGTLQ